MSYLLTSCNLKVKVIMTQIYLRLNVSTSTTVPCSLQQWDRYRVPHNVFLFMYVNVVCVCVMCCSAITDGDYRQFGTELCWQQQHQRSDANWSVWNSFAGRKGFCKPTLHLHHAQVGHRALIHFLSGGYCVF